MKRHLHKAAHHIKKHAKKVPPVLLIGAALIAGYLVVVPLFSPRSDIASVPAGMLDQPVVIGVGGFVGMGGHQAFGAVTLYKAGKSYFIRLEDNFKIEDAEDLSVYFSNGTDPRVSPLYLAPLEATSGPQTYEIPRRTSMKKYDSISILGSGSQLYGRAVIHEDEL